MRQNSILRHGLVIISLLLSFPLIRAEEPALRDLLRDGLFAEEVTRDPEAAAKQYEQVLARYTEQRAFAASALFRLAEVRRKQDSKNDAIQLYQRLLAEFPGATTETKLARGNLAALGGKAEVSAALLLDEESLTLQRLEKLAQASPDLLRNPNIMIETVEKGWARAVAFLLDQAYSAESEALAMRMAAQFGHLSILKMLLARGIDPKGEAAVTALTPGIEAGYQEIAKTLLAAGTSPDGKFDNQIPEYSTPLGIASRRGDLEIARLLIENGADVNLMPRHCIPIQNSNSTFYIGGPLHEAVFFGRSQIIDLLLEHKADVNLTEPRSKITPLWLAIQHPTSNNRGLIKRLLDLGANPDVASDSAPDPKVETWPGYPGACTPLELAVISGSVDCVRLLLDAKKVRNTPVDSTLLRTSVSRSSNPSTALEITRLLLDHGADPNPPDLIFQAIIKLWNEGLHITKPKDKSLIQEALAGNIKNPEELRSLIELLLERGGKVDPEWVSEGFPGAPMEIRSLLIRRFSYPKWAEEKAIWIIDVNVILPNWKPAITAKADEGPPMLEQWMLDEEERSLSSFQKDFPEFALYRKIDKGVTEIAVLRLKSPEAFPKLQWGDILEVRGRGNLRGFTTPSFWNGDVRESLKTRVKAHQPPPATTPR